MIYMHPVACIHHVRKRAEERRVDLLGDSKSKRLCVIVWTWFYIDAKVSFFGRGTKGL